MQVPHPFLYEINTVPWLHELSQREGRPMKLVDVPESEWRRIAGLGFNFVWLMGVWKKSPRGIELSRQLPELFPGYSAALPDWQPEDVIGSPYSIQAYEPDPSVGSWAGLRKARQALASHGLGLILDFVPNHMGPDHGWAESNADYFIQGSEADYRDNPSAFVEVGGKFLACGKDPYFSPWKDTLQLNYFNPETRQAMIGVLKKLAKYCDGVRCDMAMLVLNDIFSGTWKHLLQTGAPQREFWTEAREAVPEMIWIAEAYWETEWRLQQLGFNYTYDKRLLDRLLEGDIDGVRQHLSAGLDFQSHLVRFLENHDESRISAHLAGDQLRAAAVLINTLPGMKLTYEGQLQGRRLKLPVQLLRTAPDESDNELEAFYSSLLKVAGRPLFHHGTWRLAQVENAFDDTARNLIAYEWLQDSERALVVVNLSGGWSQGRVQIDVSGESGQLRLTDQLDGQSYPRRASDLASGLHVVLRGFQCHILIFEEAE